MFCLERKYRPVGWRAHFENKSVHNDTTPKSTPIPCPQDPAKTTASDFTRHSPSGFTTNIELKSSFQDTTKNTPGRCGLKCVSCHFWEGWQMPTSFLQLSFFSQGNRDYRHLYLSTSPEPLYRKRPRDLAQHWIEEQRIATFGHQGPDQGRWDKVHRD